MRAVELDSPRSSALSAISLLSRYLLQRLIPAPVSFPATSIGILERHICTALDWDLWAKTPYCVVETILGCERATTRWLGGSFERVATRALTLLNTAYAMGIYRCVWGGNGGFADVSVDNVPPIVW